MEVGVAVAAATLLASFASSHFSHITLCIRYRHRYNRVLLPKGFL